MEYSRIKEEIIDLVNSKREDDYWKFEKSFYSSEIKFLKDILCMANNRVNRDAYIIIGVNPDNYEMTGIEHGEHQIKLYKYIKRLEQIPFFGGIPPRIEWETMFIKGHEILALIIKNSIDTPYSLCETLYEGKKYLYAHHIYARLGNKNIDLTLNAQLKWIEYLWMKRLTANNIYNK